MSPVRVLRNPFVMDGMISVAVTWNSISFRAYRRPLVVRRRPARLRDY